MSFSGHSRADLWMWGVMRHVTRPSWEMNFSSSPFLALPFSSLFFLQMNMEI